MKRFHISISVRNFDEAIADYTHRLAEDPCVVKAGRYALWRTDTLNFSISCKPEQPAGLVRHIGFEDDAEKTFREEVDTAGITWEYFSKEAQQKEIDEKILQQSKNTLRAANENASFRLLTRQDNEMFRVLRLRACKEEPASFLEAYEDLISLPPQAFERYLDNGWIAGAFFGNELIGIAGMHRHKGRRIEHKGTVWGVYVVPEQRGFGYSKKLLSIVLTEASVFGLEVAMLSTDASNIKTIKLYKSLGFVPYGVEKKTLKLSDDHYVDDMWMMKYLHEEAL